MRNAPSPEQMDYVAALQKRLAFPSELLDRWCVQNVGRRVAEMDRNDVSRLIDKLKAWERLPPDLLRAKGQLDLFG